VISRRQYLFHALTNAVLLALAFGTAAVIVAVTWSFSR
jgi:hypothetical protein